LLAHWGFRRCESIAWAKTNKRAVARSSADALAGEPEVGDALLVPTVEHCLMGIRGTVRRSTDGHFVHCNVDADVIIADADEHDPHAKPVELQVLCENFCLGTRRLHLWGSTRDLRPGWLTVGPDAHPRPIAPLSETELAAFAGALVDEEDDVVDLGLPPPSGPPTDDERREAMAQSDPLYPRAYVKERCDAYFDTLPNASSNLVPNTPEVDALRPKSPPPRNAPTMQPANMGSNGGLGRPQPMPLPMPMPSNSGFRFGTGPLGQPLPMPSSLPPLPQFAGLPQLPQMPSTLPALPQLPGLPALPQLPQLPFAPMPGMMPFAPTGVPGPDWSAFFANQR